MCGYSRFTSLPPATPSRPQVSWLGDLQSFSTNVPQSWYRQYVMHDSKTTLRNRYSRVTGTMVQSSPVKSMDVPQTSN